MTKTVAIVGKQGPLFGDGRPSHSEVEFVSFEDSSHWVRVSNWPVHDRADAMRACFDQVTDTVMRDGDFAGHEYDEDGDLI